MYFFVHSFCGFIHPFIIHNRDTRKQVLSKEVLHSTINPTIGHPPYLVVKGEDRRVPTIPALYSCLTLIGDSCHLMGFIPQWEAFLKMISNVYFIFLIETTFLVISTHQVGTLGFSFPSNFSLLTTSELGEASVRSFLFFQGFSRRKGFLRD